MADLVGTGALIKSELKMLSTEAKATVKETGAGGSNVANQPTGKFNLKSINPENGKVNCVNCSMATDMYLKGYPVSAGLGNPTSLTALEKAYGKTFTHGLDIDQVKAMVGKGKMGIVFGNNGTGKVGHVFNVIEQKGKINFIDGQTGKAAKLDGYKNFSFMPTN